MLPRGSVDAPTTIDGAEAPEVIVGEFARSDSLPLYQTTSFRNARPAVDRTRRGEAISLLLTPYGATETSSARCGEAEGASVSASGHVGSRCLEPFGALRRGSRVPSGRRCSGPARGCVERPYRSRLELLGVLRSREELLCSVRHSLELRGVCLHSGGDGRNVDGLLIPLEAPALPVHQ